MKKLMTAFAGKPNSGKDTLLDDLMVYYAKHNPEIISASKLIRAVDKNSALWKEIETAFNSGVFIPHEITNELLLQGIKNSQGDILFLNGSTSTMAQAKLFDEQGHYPIDGFITLMASDQLCTDRAMKRIVCDTCRVPFQLGQKLGSFIADIGVDCVKCESGHLMRRLDENNVQARLDEFNEFSLPVIEHFETQASVKKLKIEIDEATAREDVFAKTTDFMDRTFDL